MRVGTRGWGEYLFIEVNTDEGITGWGEITTTTKAANRALATLVLRKYFTADHGVYLVKSEDPMEPEEMDQLLTAMQRAGKLKEFMKQARIF